MAESNSTLSERTCKKCGETKSIDKFHRHPTCVGGRLHSCAQCSISASVIRAKSSQTDKKRKSEWAKKKRLTDPAFVVRASERNKVYFSRTDVKEKMRQRAAKFRADNPEKYREQKRACGRRVASDPKYKTSNRVRSLITYSLRRAGRSKSRMRTEQILGYTVQDLMIHLERQFLPGMSWDNMGLWHIDHIIPISSFEYESTECIGFKRAWSITNLRPLWAKDNLRKQAAIIFLL